MKPCSLRPVTKRAQPWLGTLVSISVEELELAHAQAAISLAFRGIELVHRLMSFHQSESDVSRLNREASIRPVGVHAHTFELLQQAIALSAASNGCFDVSIAAELVRRDWLPTPVPGGQLPSGNWRDIELRRDRTVRFHRPLWVDLGGIAKGYAVDRAVESLRSQGVIQAVVNAGGDIRVLGKRTEPIALGLDLAASSFPIIGLSDGSIASSSGHRQRVLAGRSQGPHVDGANRSLTSSDRFVCVIAEDCTMADALTKVVMARGLSSAPLLRRFQASAHLFDPTAGWHAINADQERA